LTATLTVPAARTVGGSWRGALRTWLRDGGRHPSPNAGRCEAAMAGALGVQLGGRNTYAGRVEDRPVLGDGRTVKPDDIRAATRISAAVGVGALVLTAGLWTFRDLGVHYQLRYDAFKLRNDWAEVLRPDEREDWPRDPAVLALTRRIRDEAIAVRTASPSFIPRWGDRWWIE